METLKIAAAIVLFAFAVDAAAPDSVALDAAREEARAALADGFRDLNAGRKTLLELAGHVADMAATATNSPAMQRVLQEGAFNMYREAGELNRAAERRVPFWINLGTDAEVESAAKKDSRAHIGFA